MAAAAGEAVADAAGVGDRTSLLDLGMRRRGVLRRAGSPRSERPRPRRPEPDAIAQARDAVPGGDFRLGLMESLPWAEDSFDVVTAFDAVQYALDTEMALIEASRVLRADGRIAVSKWGPPATNEFFAFLTSIGARGVRGGQLPVTDPVEVAIRSTGVAVLATGELPAPIEIAGDAALESSLSRAGVDAGPDAIAAAARWRHADGTYRFDNRQRYWILGRRS